MRVCGVGPARVLLIAALLTLPSGAFAEEWRNVAGRWLGATDAAVESFAKVGGTLTDMVTGKFDGLSKTITIADASATLGAASAGDVRGTVSGAAAIAVGGKVTAGGAALFGEIGSVAGGAVGSFFPVVGNIAGSIVGGAVGTAAGGFICAFGYDKYLKDYVAQGVTGIVSVFDTAPLAGAMQAKRAFLWETMAPEERAKLQTFNPEEVQLLDFGTLPYVLVPKQPTQDAAAMDAQQQAALPPAVIGDPLAGVKTLEINPNSEIDFPLACIIEGARFKCTARGTIGLIRYDYSISGTVAGNILEGDSHDRTVFKSADGKCGYTAEVTGHETMTLESDGRVLSSDLFTTTFLSQSGDCGYAGSFSGSGDSVGTWRAVN